MDGGKLFNRSMYGQGRGLAVIKTALFGAGIGLSYGFLAMVLFTFVLAIIDRVLL
jgi:hypothetical protein